MPDAVIVQAVRTPVGRRNGGLSGTHPVHLSAQVLIALAERTGVRHLAVELRCEDEVEHRRRVEEREADVEDHELPEWSSLTGREWQAWPEADLVLDTGVLDVAALADLLEAHLEDPA